jgi:hypothetical protein
VFDNILDLYAKEYRPLRAGDDLFDRLQIISNDSESQAFQAHQRAIAQYSKVPSWVSIAQLKRGQEVFLAYLPAIGFALYYRSLVPGFSIPKIAAVLQATAYLAPPASKTAVQERLMDTGAFLAACLQSQDIQDILPQGEGWKAALRVRLLHAKVRRLLLTRKGTHQWDTRQLGIPINQEDLAATLLAFSTNALIGIEMLLGRPIPEHERLDYLAFWRYLGWLLGVDVDEVDGVDTSDSSRDSTRKLRPLDPCGPGWCKESPNPLEHSFAIFQSIILHLLHPDSLSVQIAHHLLRQGRRQDGDGNSDGKKDEAQLKQNELNWFYYRCIQCRRFVGDPLADALELPRHPTLWRRLLQWGTSTLYLTVFTFYTISALPRSPFRQRIVKFHRSHMKKFIEFWTESHLDRMKSRLKSSGAVFTSNLVCPFAMVTPEVD